MQRIHFHTDYAREIRVIRCILGAERGNLVQSGAELSILEQYTNCHAENPHPHPLFARNSVHSVHSGTELSMIEPITKTHAEYALLLRPC